MDAPYRIGQVRTRCFCRDRLRPTSDLAKARDRGHCFPDRGWRFLWRGMVTGTSPTGSSKKEASRSLPRSRQRFCSGALRGWPEGGDRSSGSGAASPSLSRPSSWVSSAFKPSSSSCPGAAALCAGCCRDTDRRHAGRDPSGGDAASAISPPSLPSTPCSSTELPAWQPRREPQGTFPHTGASLRPLAQRPESSFKPRRDCGESLRCRTGLRPRLSRTAPSPSAYARRNPPGPRTRRSRSPGRRGRRRRRPAAPRATPSRRP